jgi:hypothetical protein
MGRFGSSLPGPPLSQQTALTVLLSRGVNVGIGVMDESSARNTRFDVAWVRHAVVLILLCHSNSPLCCPLCILQATLDSNGLISKAKAIALVTTNLWRALGVDVVGDSDLVAYKGGDFFDFESKVVGVTSSRRGLVETF